MTPSASRTPRRARLAASAALVLLLGGLAACGGDDDDEAAGDPSAPTAADGGLTASAGDADLDAYCAAEVELEQTGAAALSGDDPVAGAQTVLDAAEEVRALAPDDVAADFDAAIETLRGVVGSGDPAALQTLDTSAVHAFDLQSCDWSTIDVTARDYAFEGVPDELDAGPHSFEITNEGAEPHVMVIVRKADGVTADWEAIMAEGEGSDSVVDVGAAFAQAGEDGYGVVDLAPGEYLAFCPIPTGTTMTAEGTGPPHLVQGMSHEFTVA